MKLALSLVASLFWAIASAAPFPAQVAARSKLPRLILYYQTTHDPSGRPISILPLINKQHIALTHLIVGAFHVHANHTIHLNDHPPRSPVFHTLWNETRLLQAAGVKVLGMVGGAAQGSFTKATLDSGSSNNNNTTTATTTTTSNAFEKSYALLRSTITSHRLDGIDLDVEEPMTQAGITRLVRRLHADFGADFIITLAPVATALLRPGGGGNLSGFNYTTLERQVGGKMIAFYNVQFYNGFGHMGNTALFDRIVASGGGWDARRIVVGQLTSPVNGGGFVGHKSLARSIAVLRRRYGEIGGVVGWEYFNGVPGGVGKPWRWAAVMTRILRPGREPRLRITRETAERLKEAWMVAARAAGDGNGTVTTERWAGLVPNVDYAGMVNEYSVGRE
ncbi:glycoside hydrolase [Chaetomidium leptoderma]|uniref:Glycoside hydrolase n=1 Tax=Chaetomidium leptoderma TaxID=669021 RepID=A0AAN6ZZK2_9PEZI|nr:glycoside hydrolase [Chaetomidium leptoderma]